MALGVGCPTLIPLVGLPIARSATTSAASLPPRRAPSIEPRYLVG